MTKPFYQLLYFSKILGGSIIVIFRTMKGKPVTTKEDLQHVEEQVQRIHQNVTAQEQRIQEAKKTVVEVG